jgi:hypothetical protein
MATTYHISQGLTDGTSVVLGDLSYTNKATALRVARHLAKSNNDPAVTDIYVDDVFGGCILRLPVNANRRLK